MSKDFIERTIYSLLEGYNFFDFQPKNKKKIMKKIPLVIGMWEQSYTDTDGKIAKEWTKKKEQDKIEYIFSLLTNLIATELELDEEINLNDATYRCVFHPKYTIKVKNKTVEAGKFLTIHTGFNREDENEFLFASNPIIQSSDFYYLNDEEAITAGLTELQHTLSEMMNALTKQITIAEEDVEDLEMPEEDIFEKE